MIGDKLPQFIQFAIRGRGAQHRLSHLLAGESQLGLQRIDVLEEALDGIALDGFRRLALRLRVLLDRRGLG